MDLDGKLNQDIERESQIDRPSEGEEEHRRLLDLRIGLALLSEEGRKQLLQHIRTLCKRDKEKASAKGGIPSA